MKKIKYYLAYLLLAGLISSGCKKEGENIFNMFDDVTVTYHSNSPYAVTDYKEVNQGDSVYLDYTITSAKTDMYAVCIFETSAAIPSKIILNDANRRTYSGVLKLKMNTRVGKTSYRIWALDKGGIYLGDGYKTITIEVRSDYKYWSSRELVIPDSVGKNSNSYLSVNTGELFTYNNGQANSAKIDLGLYRTVGTGATSANGYLYNIYSLDANPLPFNAYDVASWTKRTVLFAAPKTAQSAAFLALRTGEQIVTAGKSAKPTLKAITTGLISGSLFYFLTPEGKYGAMYVNSVSSNNSARGVFLNVDVKIQN